MVFLPLPRDTYIDLDTKELFKHVIPYKFTKFFIFFLYIKMSIYNHLL